MKRSRFTEEQIIGILKEHQAGLGAKELCRKHGVSDATFYKWWSKFGGMRDECLNEHLFDSLRHARNLVAAWRNDFNHHRPHSSLAGMTPAEYVNRSKEGQNLNRANL